MAKSINPATGDLISQYEYEDLPFVLHKISLSDAVFKQWQTTTFNTRAKYVLKLKHLLLERCNELAKTMSLEMGKPYDQAQSEIKKCAELCDYYATNTAQFLQDKPVNLAHKKAFVTFKPLGCILGVMPWNFPYWQVFRFVIPTLMAGNTVVVKHASNVFGCLIDINDLFEAAGVPEGVFVAIYPDRNSVEAIIENPHIKGVSFTGSESVGRKIGASSGRSLKKCVLELGGSDPYVVLKDADISLAVDMCLSSRMMNTGQSCIAAKRWIVDQKVYDEFLNLLLEKVKDYKFDDPFENPALGPLAREDVRDAVHVQVTDTVKAGAKLVAGGEVPSIAGYYYPATILTGVTPGMRTFDEEVFGPVASLIKANSTKHAIELANLSPYGLGGAVFSQDENKAEAIASTEIEAGSVCVNSFLRSTPELPFGGVKASGFGRELSEFTLYEFVNIKSIIIAKN